LSTPGKQSASSSALTGLQVSGHTGGVLRGVTRVPPLSHASGMADSPLCLEHLISVRTGSVRTECYYILYGKASNALYLELAGILATFDAEQGRLARKLCTEGGAHLG